MLPSLGFNEIILLGILALVVVGPKDLPLLFRKLGRWTAKLRGMAQEFRSGFDDLARQAELDDLKREVDALRRTTSLNELSRELTKPLGTLEDYAGINKPPPPPALPAPTTTTLTPPSPSRGPSGASVQTDHPGGDGPHPADESASEDAPVEGSVASNVTPIVRSAP